MGVQEFPIRKAGGGEIDRRSAVRQPKFGLRKKGRHYFELALLEDPGYALAYTGLADTFNLLGFYGQLPLKEAMPKARAAALEALRLNDRLAEGHNSLGFNLFIHDWDWRAAEAAFCRAIELNPLYVAARSWHARLLSGLGRFDAAIAEDRRAIEIDPLSVYANMHLGWMLVSARRYGEATAQLRRTLEFQTRARVTVRSALE